MKLVLRLVLLTAVGTVASAVGYLIALALPHGPLAVLLGAAGGLVVGAVLLEAFGGETSE